MAIINTWDQLNEAARAGTLPKEKCVAVSYSRRAEGRLGYADCNKSLVWSPFFEVDPKAHWGDQGRKAFVGDRAVSLEPAKAWAAERFGVKEWARNRLGDYVPAEVNRRHPIPRREK